VKVGNTLTATEGTWTSGTTFAYVWSSATTSTGIYTAIEGATAKTYVPTAANQTRFLKVTVTGSATGYTSVAKTSVATLAVAVGTFATPPVPTITGTKTVGQTLTANPGTWSPAADTYTYVWSRASTSTGTYATITGATSATYTLQSADAGKFIKVTVTGTKAGYTTVTSGLSIATTVIAAG
jgi:hypothetical protein